MRRLWVESIKHFPAEIQESLILEQPHTRISGAVPRTLDLNFLSHPGSMLDLGFENLGLSVDKFKSLCRAFVGSGVIIPAENPSLLWKLRVQRPLGTVFEPVEFVDDEEFLPPNWVEGVLMVVDDKVGFAGSRVRPDQLGPIDWAEYVTHNTKWGSGWLLKTLAGIAPAVVD